MNLQSRIVNLLAKPKQEWLAISAESEDVVSLYKEYIIPLSAIPAVCGFLGATLVGVTIPYWGTFRTPLSNGLVGLMMGYIVSLIGTYLAAVIVDRLAPSFESTGGIIPSLKMVAFASTPVWVAGVLRLIPALGLLALLAALYSIYLFYLGLPSVMKTPPDKVLPYMVVCTVVLIVISVIVGYITGIFMGVSHLMG